MSDCKCMPPCSPCNNNCPDDGEILSVDILDAEDCNTNCCGKKCNDNCGVNIQSTNDCLTVDTSECGVVKLTAKCPKPTYVTAGDNVTVTEITPPDECYMDGGDCGIKGGWKVSSKDEKVKACSGDTTPGYLNQKLEAGSGIVIDEVGCGGGNAYLKIGIKDGTIPECPDVPDLEIHNQSQFINVTQSGDHRHVVTITDKSSQSIFDNTVMIGFAANKDFKNIGLNGDGNAEKISWIATDDDAGGRDMCTGNKKLATKDGIKIKQSGYYRLYGQITVANNRKDYNRYANLGRALLRIKGEREWIGGIFASLCTAKHGAYGTQVVFKGGNGINIAQDGTISVTGASVTTSEGGGSWNVNFNQGSGIQPTGGYDGPWMTYNIGVFVDLREGDVITLGYRCQSNIPEAANKTTSFRIVGANDSSTEFPSLFGGSCLGVQLITPTLFQANTSNEFFEKIS